MSSNIFSNSLEPLTFLVVSVSTVSCCLLVTALSRNGLTSLIERLYASTAKLSAFPRKNIYFVLHSVPILLLSLVSLLFNHSLIGFEASLNADECNILLICGYVCYLEQSRQTPIRGFIFIRDLIMMVITLVVFYDVYYEGTVNYLTAATLLPIYAFYLLMQTHELPIEAKLLSLLGIKEPNQYNAKFLLTEKSHPTSYLEIKDIIAERQEEIGKQLSDFQRMVKVLIFSEAEKKVLCNFARLFIPIKKAYEINEENVKQEALREYSDSWGQFLAFEQENTGALKNKLRLQDLQGEVKEEREEREEEQEEEQEEDKIVDNVFARKLANAKKSVRLRRGSQEGFDLTGGGIFDTHSDSGNKQPHVDTSDGLLHRQFPGEMDQVKEEEEPESRVDLFWKYAFYPLYLSKELTGRCRYFMDYLLLLLLFGSVFVVSNGLAYYSLNFPAIQTVTSLLGSFGVNGAFSLYFVKVSELVNDSDFLNIFLQLAILKNVLFSLGLLAAFVGGFSLSINSGVVNVFSLTVRIVAYAVFMGWMVWNRFATRFSNFKGFLCLFVSSQAIRIIADIVIVIAT